MTLVSGPKGFQEISKPCKASRSKPEFLPVGKPFHVGVIGAGLAGLRCADILLQKGICVTILEARDRVGGRVSIPYPVLGVDSNCSSVSDLPSDLSKRYCRNTCRSVGCNYQRFGLD